MIKHFLAVVSFVSLFSSAVWADETKMCNATQQQKCNRFCQAHQGMKSCIIDISTRSGTCTCNDGASHTKS